MKSVKPQNLILGRFTARTFFEVSQVEVCLRRLPAAFDGYRLALLTDLHFGRFVTAAFVRRVLAAAEAARPDVLLLGGDMVNMPRKYTVELAGMLSDLTPRLPTYAVYGNHDYYARHGRFRRSLTEAGVEVLVNEHRLLPADGRDAGEAAAPLALVGLDDYNCGRPDYAAAVAGLPEGACTILLTHNPLAGRLVDPRRPPDLMLAGHTHGGQIRLFGRALAPPSKKGACEAGKFERDGPPVYVSRGLGVAALPVRVNAPPELAIITLRVETPA